MHCNTIPHVACLYRILVFLQSLLQAPTGLTNVHLVAVTTGDFVDNPSLLFVWSGVLDTHQGLSESIV